MTYSKEFWEILRVLAEPPTPANEEATGGEAARSNGNEITSGKELPGNHRRAS